MLDVRYTVRGGEFFQVNPDLISDLERVTDVLYAADVEFPDFNFYEEGVGLMHGVRRDDKIHPEAPWAKARFRYDGESKINSLQGILLKFKKSRMGLYVQLAEEVPEIAENAFRLQYQQCNSNDMMRINDAHIMGKSVNQIGIDRGEKYDTVAMTLQDETELIFIYKSRTFIGFEFTDRIDGRLKSTHYVLDGVDPSFYVPSFAECAITRKDVVFNEGLYGDVKPLLLGEKVKYNQPQRENIDQLGLQEKGDVYLVSLTSETPELAHQLYERFRKDCGEESELAPDFPMSLDALAQQIGGNLNGVEMPRFDVTLTEDRNPNSNRYLLTLKTISTGSFRTRNDVRSLIQGYIIGFNSTEKPHRLELQNVEHVELV